jgi:hypothetical protein|tara:strand:+ start:96 stop:314 length:219 start_codon:yes stop_codon:yes gene_type:complete
MQDKDTMSTSQESLKVITEITDSNNFTRWSASVIALYDVRVKIDQEIARYNELIATTDAHKKLNKIGDNNAN